MFGNFYLLARLCRPLSEGPGLDWEKQKALKASLCNREARVLGCKLRWHWSILGDERDKFSLPLGLWNSQVWHFTSQFSPCFSHRTTSENSPSQRQIEKKKKEEGVFEPRRRLRWRLVCRLWGYYFGSDVLFCYIVQWSRKARPQRESICLPVPLLLLLTCVTSSALSPPAQPKPYSLLWMPVYSNAAPNAPVWDQCSVVIMWMHHWVK